MVSSLGAETIQGRKLYEEIRRLNRESIKPVAIATEYKQIH